MSEERTQGKVKFYNQQRGFGFIESKGNKDIFFHCNDVEGKSGHLEENEEVEFELTQGKKGFKAIRIKKVENG